MSQNAVLSLSRKNIFGENVGKKITVSGGIFFCLWATVLLKTFIKHCHNLLFVHWILVSASILSVSGPDNMLTVSVLLNDEESIINFVDPHCEDFVSNNSNCAKPNCNIHPQ